MLRGFPLSLDWGFFRSVFLYFWSCSSVVVMNLSALDVLLCGALSFGLMIVNRLVWLGVVACLPSHRVRIWGGYMFRTWCL
ncbi:unnamed protein product [Brassica oleracea var. botrytis]